jgi:hypothetical protein
MSKMTREEFEREYLTQIPPATLLQWLEDFCDQLDCPPPDPEGMDIDLYFKRMEQWKTQVYILNKLRYAIVAEKRLNPPKEKVERHYCSCPSPDFRSESCRNCGGIK